MTDETREFLPIGTVETRTDKGPRWVQGLGIPYNSVSRSLGDFVEMVAPGFADEAEANGFDGLMCEYNHDSRYVLGSYANRTMEVETSSRGVSFGVQIPDYHKWVYKSIERRDVTGASFRFSGARDEWTYNDGVPLRTLLSAHIHEIGPVPVGAYPSADCGLRSLARFKDAPLADVVALAESRSLSKLFVRTDQPPARTLSGRNALLETMKHRFPEVAFVDNQRRNRELAEMRYPRPLSGAQALDILTDMMRDERQAG